MHKVMIIAEAGVNHNGDIKIAKQLIDTASQLGADAIKFQTFKAKTLVTSDTKKAEYQKAHTSHTSSQYEMLKSLELSYKDFEELYDYCFKKQITFLSSPFDLESIDFLNQLGVHQFKIPSGEITNYPYLEKIASLKKPVILSTGMATMQEIKDAFHVLNELSSQMTLLHCSSSYPTPMKDVNLKAMNTLKQTFHTKVGYSDHTIGIEVPIAAAALGACVIEKHFTLDKSLPGPDHHMSMEPDDFRQLVMGVRNIEQALGDGIKTPTAAEKKNRNYVRKYLVAAKEIKKGELFTKENLCAKRCEYGLSPMNYPKLLGKAAGRSYQIDERIAE